MTISIPPRLFGWEPCFVFSGLASDIETIISECTLTKSRCCLQKRVLKAYMKSPSMQMNNRSHIKVVKCNWKSVNRFYISVSGNWKYIEWKRKDCSGWKPKDTKESVRSIKHLLKCMSCPFELISWYILKQPLQLNNKLCLIAILIQCPYQILDPSEKSSLATFVWFLHVIYITLD